MSLLPRISEMSVPDREADENSVYRLLELATS